ncbi:energy transducer TonB [Hellea sp.]|nr:energy transducer TonB [Hellea sp.]
MLMKRWILSTVPAAAITVGIGLFMVGMIRTEFTPQDKAESLTLDINPVPIDIPPPREREKPQDIKRVETPPPPPRIEQAQAKQPQEDLTEMSGAVPDFVMPKIDQETFVITVSDRKAQPLVRIAPIMPPNAERSGHCNVRFNVSAEGAPYDVMATYCTQSVFERATKKSVTKWKYRPKILNGRAVAMIGVENKVSYRLSDERGNLIPE